MERAWMAKGFLPYSLDQHLLLPPDMRKWLAEGHLALFVSDVVDALDLSKVLASCTKNDTRGRAGYHPLMMVKLLVYGYCIGVTSSRKIERATYEDVAFRVLSGDQHPDHDCIAAFRKQHLGALADLFLQVLQMCDKAGLIKLGHVAIDGSKIGANASKHKAMSYAHMTETEKKLQEQVTRLLEEAARVDAEEDAKFGKGKRGDELPAELANRESRLRKIREAMAELEAEAKEKAKAQAEETRKKLDDRAQREAEAGKKTGGKPPQMRAKPEPKAQRNFTDPESRIMPDGANKGSFMQGYNAQIAVDSYAQVIVAANVTQLANDKQQLEPMMALTLKNMGRMPEVSSADAGYFSEKAISAVENMGTNLLVPASRQKHGQEPFEQRAKPEISREDTTAADRMKAKLQTDEARDLYRMRKAIVEPVFGQIKSVRGLRRFVMRGLQNAHAQFLFVALTHNILKLFRFGGRTALVT